MRWLRAVVAGGVAIAALNVTAPALADTPSGQTSFSYISDTGDYIGLGQTGSYTAGITISGAAGDVIVTIAGWGTVEIAAPRGQLLHPGTYTGVQRATFRDTTSPGLDVASNGRGCNTVSGTFTIDSIESVHTGSLAEFAGEFVQHCEGAAPALTGTVRYAAPASAPLVLTTEETEAVTGQPVDLDAALGDARSGGTITYSDGSSVLGTSPVDAAGRARLTTTFSSTGTHPLMATWSGDPTLSGTNSVSVTDGGTSFTFTSTFPPHSTVLASFSSTTDRVNVSGTVTGAVTISIPATPAGTLWKLILAPPPGQTLQVGHYANAQGLILRFQVPGIVFQYSDETCTDSGSFDVADVAAAADGTISRLDATFTDTCTSGTPQQMSTGRVRIGEPAAPAIAALPEFRAPFEAIATAFAVALLADRRRRRRSRPVGA